MRLIFISLSVLLFGCSKDDIVLPKQEYTMTIDSVLTQSGMNSLPLDGNGYYHLKLDNTKNQTIHYLYTFNTKFELHNFNNL